MLNFRFFVFVLVLLNNIEKICIYCHFIQFTVVCLLMFSTILDKSMLFGPNSAIVVTLHKTIKGTTRWCDHHPWLKISNINWWIPDTILTHQHRQLLLLFPIIKNVHYCFFCLFTQLEINGSTSTWCRNKPITLSSTRW